LPAYRQALDRAMEYVITNDAFLTAYNVVNAVQNDAPSLIKNLSIFCPRHTSPDTFVSDMLHAIRDAGLEGGEVFARPAESSGISFINFGCASDASATFVLVTVSAFPNIPAVNYLPLDDISWSLPVVCCEKTYFPRQLVPPLQKIAFSTNHKLLSLYSKAIDIRDGTGVFLPRANSASVEALLLVSAPAEDVTEVSYTLPAPSGGAGITVTTTSDSLSQTGGSTLASYEDTAVNKDFLCDGMWDILRDFASWMIRFPAVPFDMFCLPHYFDGNAVAYLHHAAVQQHLYHPTATPLDWYIYASKLSMMNYVGLRSFFILPLFIANNPHRNLVLANPSSA